MKLAYPKESMVACGIDQDDFGSMAARQPAHKPQAGEQHRETNDRV
jgi:hypothetical protein